MRYKHHFLIVVAAFALMSVAWKNSSLPIEKSNGGQTKSFISDTTYRIIPSVNNTYGYEILINQKVFIRQQNIPGLPGLNGFKRKADAEKTARLVINKLSHGIMPPSIEKRELDSLKIKL